jgi:hypothetical protein
MSTSVGHLFMRLHRDNALDASIQPFTGANYLLKARKLVKYETWPG